LLGFGVFKFFEIPEETWNNFKDDLDKG
jgi:hypothetical protein